MVSDADGSASEVDGHSNTIVAAAGSAAEPTWASNGARVSYDRGGVLFAPQLGFRNNIFVCGADADLLPGLTFAVGAAPAEFNHSII